MGVPNRISEVHLLLFIVPFISCLLVLCLLYVSDLIMCPVLHPVILIVEAEPGRRVILGWNMSCFDSQNAPPRFGRKEFNEIGWQRMAGKWHACPGQIVSYGITDPHSSQGTLPQPCIFTSRADISMNASETCNLAFLCVPIFVRMGPFTLGAPR